MKNLKTKVLIILLLAFIFRLYGLNWDQGQHLHPDERFLTMVLTSMKIPQSLGDYLDPKISTMNPYNVGYGFFVYGTFPLNLTKVLGVLADNDNYGNIHLIGRILSALFDVGTVYLVYLISKKIIHPQQPTVPLLAAFLYSIMVLPIQLSHFFTVDTFLNFFLVLSFYFLISLLLTKSDFAETKRGRSFLTASFLGFSFGLALACKISAALFLPVIGLGFLFILLKSKKIIFFALCALCFGLCAYGAFRFNQPQAFVDNNFFRPIPNPKFVHNLKELNVSADPNGWYPPAIQWIGTKPIIFPLKNMVLWGLGLPLGIISLGAIVFFINLLIQSIIKKRTKFRLPLSTSYLLMLFWIIFLFIYQGVQFGKVSRYFYPIYPFLAILSALFLSNISTCIKKTFPHKFLIFNFSFFILILVYPLSFLNIYTKPITRVTASEWIYQNILPGSILSYEHWDDGLPLGLKGKSSSLYQLEELALFAPDTEEKWKIINRQLAKIDYLVLSSNRLWGSIGRLPQKYPVSAKFYQDLLAGKLNFEKIAEFTSYPCFPPGKYNLFCFPDQSADESFTVYDHPKVMIFKRRAKIN